ncbi:2-methylcitrate dehydratase PrpD [Novosphingobium sp. SG751A]|uniref:MmgE/PrpD family protein n=1 Tax=Novosphingobium sp. SG751A TaxID=2587000 RepID=UPI00155590A8|nr:MmgE/PrpD family protein [Novosphingobium sp. SG751A]NOW44979.1 2-methylcitrate dehydratase PrpD [Novosphingobium sp. SG751A]
MHAIQELANFAANQAENSLPDSAVDACSLLVLDLVSSAAAGLNSTLAKAARATARDIYGSGSTSVWFADGPSSVAGAAMANAAAASALDIDDGHRGAAGHPGAGIIPAVFAVAQSLNASSERIFDAIALGYEVGLRVAASRPTPTIETYFSGRWVNYGVAVAAGRLLGLSPIELAHAMAIAGAEGPIAYSKGTSLYQGSTVKEVIPPAVIAGLTGAYRARAGATGPIDLLDCEDRFDRSILTDGLGGHWAVEDCYLKPYACCRHLHAAIDALHALRQPATPVTSLRIETFPRGLGLINERAPTTLEGAQYSFYFSCALAAIHGVEALQPVDPRHLGDERVLELASRIELVAHDDFADSFPKTTPGRVIIDQGRGLESLTVLHPLGDVANPMDREQIIRKFKQISSRSLGPARQKAIVAAIDGLRSHGFQPLFVALDAP